MEPVNLLLLCPGRIIQFKKTGYLGYIVKLDLRRKNNIPPSLIIKSETGDVSTFSIEDFWVKLLRRDTFRVFNDLLSLDEISILDSFYNKKDKFPERFSLILRNRIK